MKLGEIHSLMSANTLYIPARNFRLYISSREKEWGNKVYRTEAFLSRLKSVHLSLTARQLSRELPGGCKVDLHNYTVMIYDDSPDLLSPEEQKFLSHGRRDIAMASRLFRKTISREPRTWVRSRYTVRLQANSSFAVEEVLLLSSRDIRPSFLPVGRRVFLAKHLAIIRDSSFSKRLSLIRKFAELAMLKDKWANGMQGRAEGRR